MMEETGYFDMHCHILPGVDDGSQSMEMSMEMLKMEYAQGVRTILLTPHCIAGRTQPRELQEQFAALVRCASKQFPDMQMYIGNELMYSDTIIEELAAGHAFTLGGSKYALVEFYTDIPWKQLGSALRRLGSEGYRPVLAHMERYDCLVRRRERVDELISQGILMQMNIESITGGVFDRQAAECRRLIESGRIHLLGTDAHRIGWREPNMGEGIRVLYKKVKDAELLHRIIFENPDRVLRNEYVDTSL